MKERTFLMPGGCIFFFQAEDGIRDYKVTGVQSCALPISVIGRIAPSAWIWLPWVGSGRFGCLICANPFVTTPATVYGSHDDRALRLRGRCLQSLPHQGVTTLGAPSAKGGGFLGVASGS